MFVKNLIRRCDFVIFRILLLTVILFCSSNSYAQKTGNSSSPEQATVVLKDGAKIFSVDEAFNEQIRTNVVVLKNAELKSKNNSSGKVFQAMSSKQKPIQKDFKREVKNAEEKKQNEDLKKVKKEIKKHKERKAAFRKFDLNNYPSPSNFLSSNSSSKNYVAPSHSGNDFSKVYVFDKDIIKRALSYLHAAKYIHYNNKSLDYCYSQVYSVRPPPFRN
jgi:hypothetical protein